VTARAVEGFREFGMLVDDAVQADEGGVSNLAGLGGGSFAPFQELQDACPGRRFPMPSWPPNAFAR
jgi:hypothetical protein